MIFYNALLALYSTKKNQIINSAKVSSTQSPSVLYFWIYASFETLRFYRGLWFFSHSVHAQFAEADTELVMDSDWTSIIRRAHCAIYFSGTAAAAECPMIPIIFLVSYSRNLPVTRMLV